MPVLAIRPDTSSAPELTLELAEGFIVGVRMVNPDHSDEAVKKFIAKEWPGALKEPKGLDIVETILGMMKDTAVVPTALRDVAPGVLLGILRANPSKYIERYQLEDLVSIYYPVSTASPWIDKVVESLGAGVISVEKDSDPKRWRYWRRYRPETE